MSITRRLVTAGFLALLACAGPSEEPPRESGIVHQSGPDPTQPIIQERVEQLRTVGVLDVRGSAIASWEVVSDFYENRAFLRAWTDSAAVADLFRAIQEIERDGLDPRDYHLQALTELRDQVAGDSVTPALLADFDLVMSDALVRLGYHILFGKVDPERLDANWNMAREIEHLEPAAIMQRAIDSGKLFDIIEDYKPQHPLYLALKHALDQYRGIQAAGGWPTVPDGPTLKQGVTDSRIPALRQRLALEGDYTTPTGDTASVFDEALVAAVKRFQHRHTLDEDGEVGRGTRTTLNVPVERRIEQLLTSLERARWILHDLPNTFIAVNIAGFRVYFVKEGRVVWETRAQVGRAYRATPIFKANLKYLVFNPTWTVPPGILERDILPAARQDPSSIASKGLNVLDPSGNQIDPLTVDWSAYTGRNLPYTLRQDAGPRNALGRVKFIFPNEHSVFLHDTPSRGLFDKATRTFSSGCVRVENPLRLAELVLDDPEQWTMDAMRRVVENGETRTVFLQKPIAVLLLYWTASVGFDGDVHFWPDVYDRDRAVLDGLRGEFQFRDRPIVRIAESD
jgi:murein L,D-transpeptidase YcbB/YkuD